MLLFTQRFVTWYFCFSCKGMQPETLVSRKHKEDVLVFFSQLEINGRKMYAGWKNGMVEERFPLFKTKIFRLLTDKQELI